MKYDLVLDGVGIAALKKELEETSNVHIDNILYIVGQYMAGGPSRGNDLAKTHKELVATQARIDALTAIEATCMDKMTVRIDSDRVSVSLWTKGEDGTEDGNQVQVWPPVGQL
jgi:hypothetical protein